MIAVRLRIRQGTLNDPGLVCLGAADGGERRLPSGHAFELRGDRERLSAGGLREDDGVEGFLLDAEAAAAGEDVLIPEGRRVDQVLAAEWRTVDAYRPARLPPQQMLLEEGRGPACIVVPAGFGLDGMRLHRIDHHLERFL